MNAFVATYLIPGLIMAGKSVLLMAMIRPGIR